MTKLQAKKRYTRKSKRNEKIRKARRAYIKNKNLVKYKILPKRKRYYKSLETKGKVDRQKRRFSFEAFLRTILRLVNPVRWYKNRQILKVIKEADETR